jgi:acetyltransferase
MIALDGGVELILGAKRDPVFGSVIVVGTGGIATNVQKDHALGLPPLNDRLALHMLESLRSWPLLQGYRGRPGANLDRLLEILMRFSYLVAEHPEIRELDINPLLATPNDVVALDAACILAPYPSEENLGPHAHLAICPYPEDHSRRVRLKDGTLVTVRPIKPEDEPLWHELHANTSPESLRLRFRSLLRQTTHEMATRHCFIDYEREMTLVAEFESDGATSLVGVGGFSCDADRQNAEYAVMVTDAWQGKGLGGILLDHCTRIARRWGIRRMYAETDLDNAVMIALFLKRGFQMRRDGYEGVVYLTKHLDQSESADTRWLLQRVPQARQFPHAAARWAKHRQSLQAKRHARRGHEVTRHV